MTENKTEQQNSIDLLNDNDVVSHNKDTGVICISIGRYLYLLRQMELLSKLEDIVGIDAESIDDD